MLGLRLSLPEYLEECCRVIRELNLPDVQDLSGDLFDAWHDGKFVFVCGNGGAGSTAGHFAEDLLKSTLDPVDFQNDDAKRLKVMSLSENTSAILAWANDEGFERIFVEQLKNFISRRCADRNERKQQEYPPGRRMGQPPRTGDMGTNRLRRRRAANVGVTQPSHIDR